LDHALENLHLGRQAGHVREPNSRVMRIYRRLSRFSKWITVIRSLRNMARASPVRRSVGGGRGESIQRRRSDMMRAVQTSDASIQPSDNTLIGAPLDRRSFLIAAGAAAGCSPVNAFAQSATAASSAYRRVDAYSHFSSLKFIDFAEKQGDRPFVLRSMYERLPT